MQHVPEGIVLREASKESNRDQAMEFLFCCFRANMKNLTMKLNQSNENELLQQLQDLIKTG
jgi:hypothetical protein